MTKEDLIKLLKKLEISISEGEQDDVNHSNIFPRLLFFDYLWDFNVASSEIYNCLVTYQISYFSRLPRDLKFIELIKLLIKNKCLTSTIKKEYVENDGGFWHFYFEISVEEDILCMGNKI